MYFNSAVTLASADADTTFATSYTAKNFDMSSIQVIWSGLDAADGTVTINASNDKLNWSVISEGATTMVSAADSKMFTLWSAGYEWVQVAYQPGANAAGTVVVYSTQKGRR